MPADVIRLIGQSGRSYSLHLYPWGQDFKPLGGIYAAMTNKPNGLHVQYVGETGDLSQRPEHHHRESSFRRAGVTHVAAMVENDERARLQIEADLVRGLRPPLNQTDHG